MDEKKNILIGCLCALGCELLFGLSYMFTKQATNTASAFALLGWRFLIAIIVMSICVALGIMKIELTGKKLKPLLTVALFSPIIYFTGETLGIGYTTVSESGAFLACIPVVSVIASTVILKKKPAKQQAAGILITLIGVLVTVFVAGTSASFSAVGYVMLSVAVISYALYSVFVEKASEYTGAEITFGMLAAGTIVFGILAMVEAIINGNLTGLITLPLYDIGFLIAILYQGIGCSVLAFFLFNIAISKIGVNRTASFIGVATVVSIIAGIVILHESFSVIQIIGTLIIIVGVYTANVKVG